LLLRLAIGISIGVQSAIYLAHQTSLTLWTGLIGIGLLVTGVALLVGLFTPLAGVIAGLGSLGFWLSWFPHSTANLFDTFLPVALMMVMAAAIVLIGPGAYSLDARLFGRREIIIPPHPPSAKS
jgi:uncharacterized membrane protein YphA (DoxX/SURF4 family)